MSAHALDRRIYRQVDRPGSTSSDRYRILMAAEPGDYAVIFYSVSAAAWGAYRVTRLEPERAVFRIITIPDNRLTGVWEGELAAPCQRLPLDVGEIERFGWHKIQDLGKPRDPRGSRLFWQHYGLLPPPPRRLGRSRR